jgi:hypothetical protein
MVKHYFDAPEGSADYFFMIAVAERRFFGESATAPGIHFSRFDKNGDRVTISHFGQSFTGYGLHDLFIGDK